MYDIVEFHIYFPHEKYTRIGILFNDKVYYAEGDPNGGKNIYVMKEAIYYEIKKKKDVKIHNYLIDKIEFLKTELDKYLFQQKLDLI